MKSEPPTWLKFDSDWQHKHYYKVQCQIALWLRVSRAGWKKGLLDWNLLSIKYIFSVQSSLALLQLSAVGLKSERWGPECSKEGLAGENNPMRCTRCSSQWLCFFFFPHFTFFYLRCFLKKATGASFISDYRQTPTSIFFILCGLSVFYSGSQNERHAQRGQNISEHIQLWLCIFCGGIFSISNGIFIWFHLCFVFFTVNCLNTFR